MSSSARLLVVIIIFLLMASAMILATYLEALVLFTYWMTNQPAMLIKLLIRLPDVSADLCFVMVRRFPTPYNPTRGGLTELVYQGVVTPGVTIEVNNVLFAYVAKYRYDEVRGRLLVDYYEPQEYVVMVTCMRGGNAVFKWGKVIEVYPRSIVHTETIVVGAGGVEASESVEGQLDASSKLTCNIYVTREANYSNLVQVKVGKCHTFVKGPRVYSIDGLQVSLKIYSYIVKPSAVYMEAFYDLDYAFSLSQLKRESAVQWKPLGRKLAYSLVSAQTAPITGNYSDQAYFVVDYMYEFFTGCVSLGVCYTYWLLYPRVIQGVTLSSSYPERLPHDLRPYSPPSPPPYAHPGSPGTIEIGLARLGGRELRDLGVISTTTIEFTYAGVWSSPLTVKFYKLAREDNQYTTFSVVINSTRHYWWWYKDDDPWTFEILVAPRD